jgi:hypothetical protein
MKSILKLWVLLLTLSMVSCEELLVENDDMQEYSKLTIDETTLLKEELNMMPSNEAQSKFPALTFKQNQKGNYRLLIKDKTITSPDPNGTVKVSLAVRKGGEDPIEEVTFTFGGIDRVMSVPMPTGTGSYGNQIVEVSINYVFGNGGEKNWNFHVWNYADGTTALQKPEVTKVHFVDDWQGETSYMRARVVVVNDPAQQVKSVQLKFNEPFTGPKPLATIAYLKQKESDSIGDEANGVRWLTQIPMAGASVGFTYSTGITLLGENGKTVGSPISGNVTVAVKKNAPVMLSSTLTSKDKGATWDITVTIEDKDQWVEKMIYEFIKPYPGPAPTTNPFTLVRVGEKPGNVEVYAATGIKFEQNPTGFIYTAMVYHFGSGTRRSAGQANNKAELL